MRKSFLLLFTVLLTAGLTHAQNISNCGTDLHARTLREQNPQVYDAALAAMKAGWEAYKADAKNNRQAKKAEKIIIPVVFHIFHNNGNENLTDAQINGIMTSLNKYYNADPSLVGNVRPEFDTIVANCNFEFRLARKDPNGNCTNGIVRVQTPLAARASNDIKKLSVWDTKRYMNIWTASEVYSNGRQVGGFAQFPFTGSSLTDGLLIVANQSLSGNTVAHEIGHCMGLYHPFQGSALPDSCANIDDEVDDTPRTFFIPGAGAVLIGRGNLCANTTFNTCKNEEPDLPDMQENVMDYFEGSCSGVMFSQGQYERMMFMLETYRKVLYSQENLIATGVLDPATACAPTPAIGTKVGVVNTYGRSACVGTSIDFVDLSYNGTATAWSWDFGSGATPATSTIKNPTGVSYSTPGKKTITLTVTGSGGTTTKVFTDFITVPDQASINYPDYRPDYAITADGWETSSEDAVSWQPTASAVTSGSYSMKLPGSDFEMYGKEYILTSPFYDLSGASAPYIEFKYAFARNAYPGSTDPTADKMLLQGSVNCGLSWQLIKQFQGTELSTITDDAAIPYTVSFVPGSPGQWVTYTSALGNTYKQNRVRFRWVVQSAGGNNLYIDDIAIGQKTGLKELSAKDINLNIFPNPFNASTQISYTLNKGEDVNVEVFDIVGKKVATLYSGKQAQGLNEVTFDKAQTGVNTGLYFVKIIIGGSSITQKVLVK